MYRETLQDTLYTLWGDGAAYKPSSQHKVTSKLFTNVHYLDSNQVKAPQDAKAKPERQWGCRKTQH